MKRALKELVGVQCSAPDCNRPVLCKSLCQAHYQQMHLTGELRPIRPRRSGPAAPCFADGCSRLASVKELCQAHYEMLRQKGDLQPIRQKAPVRPVIDYVTIVAMRANGASMAAIGKQYGISRERVRQLLNKAVAKGLASTNKRPGPPPPPPKPVPPTTEMKKAALFQRFTKRVDGHLIWTGTAIKQAGKPYPVLCFYSSGGTACSLSVRRYAWEKKFGRAQLNGLKPFCGKPLCVEPDHQEVYVFQGRRNKAKAT